MKNIHVLPTDKATKLFIANGNLFNYHKSQQGDGLKIINQNIHITSDETPKLNDWFLDTIDKVVFKVTEEDILTAQLDGVPFNFKKIILTTDQDLIADGVQAIDDEFLEWFVKNPSCEEVEIEESYSMSQLSYSGIEYEIIIPKEEHKQDNKWSESTGDITSDYFIAQSKAIQKCMHLDAEMAYRSLPKRGKSYNEEDMFNFLEFINNRYYGSFSIDKEDLQDWFEQFKNK